MVKFSQLKILSWRKKLREVSPHPSGHCRTWTPVEHPALSFCPPPLVIKGRALFTPPYEITCQGNIAGCFKGFNKQQDCVFPAFIRWFDVDRTDEGRLCCSDNFSNFLPFHPLFPIRSIFYTSNIFPDFFVWPLSQLRPALSGPSLSAKPFTVLL